MIHLYYGNGKGKTTAAAGLSARCCGRGWPVVFAQFLKGGASGELSQLERLGIPVFRQSAKLPFTFQMTEEQKTFCKAEQKRVFSEAVAASRHFGRGLLVLDELVDALETGMLGEEARVFLEEATQAEKGHAPEEIVITGHSAPAWLVALAGYVTEFKKRKHPYDTGLSAREGIEW